MLNKYYSTILLADNIAALKEIWFIGDETLYEIFHTLPAMRREAKISKQPGPYLYDQYNVTSFTAFPSQLSNVLKFHRRNQ